MTPLAGATIFTNATVITLDAAMPRARGLRIEGDRVTHLFADVPPKDLSGERVDLGGATVLPGLVDAHIHLRSLGLAARSLDFRGTTSSAAVVAAVAAAVAELPAGALIRGTAWDQNDWRVQRFPTAAMLDAVAPEHLIWLTRVDGHAVWVNSAFMRLAGIDRTTKDPPGGEILRDADGAPTGIFVDNAIRLISLVSAKLSRPSAAELRSDLQRALEICARAGLTGVHDVGTDPAELEQLLALERAGALHLRVTVYLEAVAEGTDALIERPPQRDGLLRILGVKLYADGALGSRGAALLAPYADRPDTSGLLLTDPDDLEAKARRIHAAGYQLAIHAIGDRGNRIALGAIAAAQGGDRTRRHRIEHAQVLNPDDIPLFAALGVIASMQPTHATSDMPWAEARLGRERLAGAYAWQRLRATGAHLAFGSDAPVEEENPWHGVYAAVTRCDAAGEPKGGWFPDQALDLDQALRGFTSGPAFVTGDSDLGVIRVGSLADLTVVEADPFGLPPARLRAMKTLRTIVAGREVFRAEGATP